VIWTACDATNGEGMKTISFVNMKGGVGKTTVALNVADYLARVHNQKVAVIDVDPQFNVTQCLFTGDEYVKVLGEGGDTILDVFDPEARKFASAVTGASPAAPKELADIGLTLKEKVWTLPGNIELYRLEMVAGEGREFALKRFIEQAIAPAGFDYVVIDTPPTPSIWMTSALIASDYYVIPVKPDPLSMIGIDLLRSIIERRTKTYGLTLKCLGIFFTMVERPDSVIYSNARANLAGNKFWKDKMFRAYMPKRAELVKQQLSQPFIMKMEDYELRRNLKVLVEEILEKI
jgi:chromosome partitioning protein